MYYYTIKCIIIHTKIQYTFGVVIAMRKLCFTVPPQYDGVALRGFRRSFAGISSRLFTELKRTPGGITRGGLTVIAPDILHAGDEIVLSLPVDENIQTPVPLPIPIRYEDEDVLVCEKNAGMPMYPCPGHDADSLANAASFHQKTETEKYAFRPIYRLDRDTTGLVVLAKNSYTASRLARSVKKTYLAVCEGNLTGSGIISLPIALKPGHTIQRCVSPQGEEAVTRWRAVAVFPSASLVAIHLETGRTHQIRVHFSSMGHPLAGDDMYGGSRAAIGRQALHCAEVRFRHPVSGNMLRIRSELPGDMRRLLNFYRNSSE